MQVLLGGVPSPDVKLHYADHRSAPAAWARALGISEEAVQLYLASDVIDLHIDSFIWTRLFGYDLLRRHGRGLFNHCFYGQVDLPRLLEAQISGATWVITTNPWRSQRGRKRTFARNLTRLIEILSRVPQVNLVRNIAEYRAARRLDKHAAFVGIQGANALGGDLEVLDEFPHQMLLRATLVHLTSSDIGTTSSPAHFGERGLTRRGSSLLEQLNAAKILVDLAHIGEKGFFEAVAIHDKTQPLIVTHTGIDAVHSCWRNIDDRQIRAVADTGGTIGVMYHSSFLGDGMFSGRAESIVRHLEHIINTAGDEYASLGSDWDGSIVTPRDMPSCLELPRLVQIMLQRGWSPERVQKVLGGNFLRVLEALRGADDLPAAT